MVPRRGVPASWSHPGAFAARSVAGDDVAIGLRSGSGRSRAASGRSGPAHAAMFLPCTNSSSSSVTRASIVRNRGPDRARRARIGACHAHRPACIPEPDHIDEPGECGHLPAEHGHDQAFGSCVNGDGSGDRGRRLRATSSQRVRRGRVWGSDRGHALLRHRAGRVSLAGPRHVDRGWESGHLPAQRTTGQLDRRSGHRSRPAPECGRTTPLRRDPASPRPVSIRPGPGSTRRPLVPATTGWPGSSQPDARIGRRAGGWPGSGVGRGTGRDRVCNAADTRTVNVLQRAGPADGS
jgi:hypothetical protein